MSPVGQRFDESTPQVQYNRAIHGSGRILSDAASISVTGFTLERSDYSHDAEWNFTGLTADQDALVSEVIFGRTGPVRFEGVTAAGTLVEARSIRARSLQGRHFAATAREVQLGPAVLSFEPKNQSVTVFLTPTEIALHEVEMLSNWWTGERKVSEGFAREKVVLPSWSSSLGVFKLSVRYEWEHIRAGDVEGQAALPRPALCGGLTTPSRDVAGVITSLVDQIAPVVRIISFLSRRHVDWSQIVVHSFGPREVEETIAWKSSWFTRPQSRTDALVYPQLLPEDYLDSLVGALNGLPYKDAANITIGFLIGSGDGDYFETSVMNTFTAFETLVSGISQHEGTAYLMSDKEFRALRRDLAKQIEDHPIGSSLPLEKRAGVLAKLPELRRAPIVDRMVELLVRHQTKWADLWPPGSQLEAELRAAYRRRSILIHEGRIEDGAKSDLDQLRIHALAERLLYKLLGGKPEWHGPMAYRHTGWLSRVSTPPTGPASSNDAESD